MTRREIIPTEHQEQCAVIQWAKLMEPRHPALALLYAIPNGGDRHAAVGRKLKAEGVRAGVPDLCLPVSRHRYNALYIEMKRADGGRISKAQAKWIKALAAEKNKVEVCAGAGEAFRIIEEYLND